MHVDDLPDSLQERVTMMERILISAATGGSHQDPHYASLRRQFIASHEIKSLLPSFVRTYRSLDAFWPYIKNAAGSYAERRQIINEAFTPLMDHLEGVNHSPNDIGVSDTLQNFNAESVHAIWSKAIERRLSDPEGAITIARTLLETVCKYVLDELKIKYNDSADLPKLYTEVAKALSLAPSQHTEEAIKSILGGAMKLVNGIGTLRNRLSDSHGRGARLPVRPTARHASLAVNTAGAVATFIVETFNEREDNL